MNIFADFFKEESYKLLLTERVKEYNNLHNGYEMLRYMCKNIRNKYSSFRGGNGMSERVVFITDQLNIMDIDYKVISFDYVDVNKVGYGSSKLMNVQVHIPATKDTKDTIIFTAHHDIANVDSENCQDNTASVCNLLHLCKVLKNAPKRNKNTIIVFTDAEECGGRGANKLSEMIMQGRLGDANIKGIVGLELTANGKALWVEEIAKDKEITKEIVALRNKQEKRIDSFRTPYNECMTFRRYGLNSVCIGVLPEEEAEDKKNRKPTSTWSLCHSRRDTFEHSAKEEDMNEFVEFLVLLVNEEFSK